jgi:hypothetical protein
VCRRTVLLVGAVLDTNSQRGGVQLTGVDACDPEVGSKQDRALRAIA